MCAAMSGQSALPIDSMGNPWNGSYVFSSGNLKLDLLHNFAQRACIGKTDNAQTFRYVCGARLAESRRYVAYMEE
jgi:Mn-containing catalase